MRVRNEPREGFFMTIASKRYLVDQDGVFTAVEHAVLAKWFDQPMPATAASIKLKDALAELGFEKSCEPYSQSDATVAHTLLEAVDHRLLAFTRMEGDELVNARHPSKPRHKPRRQAALLPHELFGIDWCLSAPGFSWPVHYHLVWTPIYDRYVVTASADCTDLFGYADFALGHFSRGEDIERSVLEIIKRNWTMLQDECSQPRWEALISTGLIKEDAINLLADQVWPEIDDDDDLEVDGEDDHPNAACAQ
jgi:hypothetical protein